ncbi:hypothetical protein [Cellulomonas sp. ICMP 17802]|uniref:hypothetical protein n=1 Tax=Cellulomonas sp. ICMP 17802 TaxID=3239199 RepID=UPI00351B574F
MPAPATGPLRLVRAGTVAVVTVALAALAHVLAGGGLPPVVVLVALTALVLAAAVVLTARRLGPLGALVLLGVGQLAVHSSFSLFTSMACMPGAMGGAALSGHAHHAGTVLQAQAAACPASDAALVPPLLGASAMLVLHVVATLAAALVIAGADRALWWLAAWLRPLVGTAAAVVVAPRPSLPTPAEVPGSGSAWWRDVVPLRGPPARQSLVAPLR